VTGTGLGSAYRKLFAAATVSNLGDGVGQIAYPWLASAVTRNPVLVAVVFVAQRLPWLLFSLPAGVITDRRDRRRLMVAMNASRALITVGVAVTVLAQRDDLPAPDVVARMPDAVPTDAGLYLLVVAATLLLGMAEVLHDNSAQTFLPSIVPAASLERANGRLWSAEQAANAFLGPPLGAALLWVGYALPFFFDAGTFAVAAVLVSLIPPGGREPSRRPLTGPTGPTGPTTSRTGWRAELAEGFRWLWHHPLLRSMAVILGLLNALGMMTFAMLVLFAQEILGTSAAEFALLTTSGAAGAVAGGWSAARIVARLGPGPSLWLTLLGGGVLTAAIGLMSWWPAVWLFFGVYALFGTVWNVVTVSLRQRAIPDHLLGRVNSVYRFFGWGMMPLGSLAGGLLVVGLDAVTSREWALRLPWLIAGALHLVLWVFAAPRLTTRAMLAAEHDDLASH
jgi:MFS family permease